MLCALKTSINLWYSFALASRSLSLNLQEPKTPPALNFNDSIDDCVSFDVSIRSSLRAPSMPFLEA